MAESTRQKELHIVLTDARLHSERARNTKKSIYRGIATSIDRHKKGLPAKGGRFYANEIRHKKDGKIDVVFPLSDDLQKLLTQAERDGIKVRFFMPKSGIPIFAPKNMNEIRARMKNQKHRNKH